MTLSELRTQVYYRIGRAQDLTSLNTDILYALNTIQREVNLTLNLQELMVFDKTSLTLSATTTNYNLPTEFLKMLVAWDNDEYQSELQRITPTEYKNFLSDVDSTTGTDPQHYDILGSSSNVKQIYLFPLKATIPSGSITAFADYSGTVAGTIKATDATHGLVTGDVITITTLTGSDYAGTYTVTRIDADTFYFTATWVATGTASWVQLFYIPMVYIQKLTDLASDSDSNILTTVYPDLLIEGAAYILCRDNLYVDNPERIAFRRGEYQKQIDAVKIAQRQPDKLNKISPKRLIPTITKLYTTQYQGYTS